MSRLVTEKKGFKDSQIKFMRMALAEAKKGLGQTSPNPMVGAVVARGDKLISKGYHERAGTAHAEVVALDRAVIKGGKGAKGADIYVTLEPCPNFGLTPPCTDAIIDAGIGRVFIAQKDPNSRVRGRGIRRLKRAGIEVFSGLLQAEATLLNEAYNKAITMGLPFVTLKLASTLDGRISTVKGESKWITSKDAREDVHRLRSTVDCVMVGSKTVLADDPELTVRSVKKGQRRKNPARAVLDSKLVIPPTAKIFKSAGKNERVFVFTSNKASAKKRRALEAKGVEVIIIPVTKAGLSVKAALKALAKSSINSLLIEGGSALATSALRAKLVDKIYWYTAPIIIGGDGGTSVGELGIKKITDKLELKRVTHKMLGSDILTIGYV